MNIFKIFKFTFNFLIKIDQYLCTSFTFCHHSKMLVMAMHALELIVAAVLSSNGILPQ